MTPPLSGTRFFRGTRFSPVQPNTNPAKDRRNAEASAPAASAPPPRHFSAPQQHRHPAIQRLPCLARAHHPLAAAKTRRRSSSVPERAAAEFPRPAALWRRLRLPSPNVGRGGVPADAEHGRFCLYLGTRSLNICITNMHAKNEPE